VGQNPLFRTIFLKLTASFIALRTKKAVELVRELQANPSPLIALDLETFGPGEKGGLYPDLGHIRLLSICVPCSKPVLFDVGYLGYGSLPWSELFANRETIAHNACFEIKWILDKFGFRLPKIFDTMLAARHLQNGIDGERQHVGLATVMQRYLGRDLPRNSNGAISGVNSSPCRSSSMPPAMLNISTCFVRSCGSGLMVPMAEVCCRL
jgi:3'-5' exonuclease